MININYHTLDNELRNMMHAFDVLTYRVIDDSTDNMNRNSALIYNNDSSISLIDDEVNINFLNQENLLRFGVSVKGKYLSDDIALSTTHIVNGNNHSIKIKEDLSNGRINMVYISEPYSGVNRLNESELEMTRRVIRAINNYLDNYIIEANSINKESVLIKRKSCKRIG